MRKHHLAIIVAAAIGAIVLGTTIAQGGTPADPNEGGGGGDVATTNNIQAVGDTCGTATIPGPSTSTDITVTLSNAVSDLLANMTLDSFAANNNFGLVQKSVFNIVAPTDGAVTNEYPGAAADGRGPVVLEFTSFNAGENSTFSLDPDTYAGEIDATVQDMAGTVVEVAYAGLHRRCKGTMKIKNNGSAKATLKQKSSLP